MNTLTILLEGEVSIFQQIFGSPMVMLLLIFIIMWLFMVRPQQKKQKELQNFQNTLAPGTQIITQGGILGTVKGIDEVNNTIKVEVANGVTIQVARNAVFPLGVAPEAQK